MLFTVTMLYDLYICIFDLGMDRMIILKWILGKCGVLM